jgi:hypothetical protein
MPDTGDAARRQLEQVERRRGGGRRSAFGRRDHPGLESRSRELAPKLLSELGDLGSAVGVQKLEGMSRYLERFELTVQRIQQDLNGLRPA